MPEAAVVTTLRGFKADLIAEEAAQRVEMVRYWHQVEKSLGGQIEALAERIAALAARDETVSPRRLYRSERYTKLLAQAQEQTALYARYADGLITQRQTALVILGVQHAVEAVGLVGPVGMTFDRLSPAAVEDMIDIIAGKTSDGSPLGKLLAERMVKAPDAWKRLTNTLVDAAAQGWSPRKTAKLMKDDLSQGLEKALIVARTQQLWAYRSANVQSFQVSGLVRGQMRLTAHNDCVCGPCLADEGTIYPIDKTIPDHPQGACMSIPLVNGAKVPQWSRGEDWFKTQDGATQSAILGPEKLQAWKDRRFGFDELKLVTKSKTWGEGVKVASLKDLMQ